MPRSELVLVPPAAAFAAVVVDEGLAPVEGGTFSVMLNWWFEWGVMKLHERRRGVSRAVSVLTIMSRAVVVQNLKE